MRLCASTNVPTGRRRYKDSRTSKRMKRQLWQMQLRLLLISWRRSTRRIKDTIVECRIDFDLIEPADRSIERRDVRCSNDERQLETTHLPVVAEVPLNVERAQQRISHTNSAQ